MSEQAAGRANLLDLPVDILLMIFPYLDASDFLSLTSSCTALHQDQFIRDAAYWSNVVRNTFRVPNQPVVQNDGTRWMKLYKRLLTQSRIYTWGNNERACLGHSDGLPRNVHRRRADAHISWPAAMQGTAELGIISDVQCGGWSTSLLTSKGALYTVGVLDGAQLNRRPFMQPAMKRPTALRYPPGFAQAAERHDPSTAIRQFSAGRAHVLGLSDSGRIWSWQNIDHAALHVRFIHHDTQESSGGAGRGTVKKVVGGWNKSAALVEGSGIVVWDVLKRDYGESEIEDAALVLESVAVPKTSFVRPKSKNAGRQPASHDDDLATTVGEVRNLIVLENLILFSTDLGKVFACQMHWTNNQQSITPPFELPLSMDTENADANFATDVQGSFRSFAVFTRSGAVLTCGQDRLMDLIFQQTPDASRLADLPQSQQLFSLIPALQSSNVISVAFGDYHYHALHSTGHITSYGKEPQACGALGLGGQGDPEGRLRGIRYQGMAGDGRLVPHAYTEGRRVWFEKEKRDWISFLTSGGVDHAEAIERMRMALGSPATECQGEVSEWIEQEGRDWEGKFGVQGNEDDGLGAYFALSVTAAGWHSGALVLVNEDLAEKAKRACEVRDPASPLKDTEEPTASEAASESTPSPSQDSSLLNRATTTALDYSRWFLGLEPYSAAPPPQPSQTPTNNNVTVTHQEGRPAITEQIHTPSVRGASPREGYEYRWAGDHFPRLRLASGIEMPGQVPFDQWRYGRPEFRLEEAPRD
ncbi:hypothetical protein B0A50_07578 [Salinomyces thailandicus]|uniref:F-box domain-containing protein n=1 Tax=Salinomyces thailandicus TaxID=706561 RepID=A0A4U0TN71_9PEZI|nr:hypothetical protein B0A50_07578 [Salinomyces thailandica]